MATKPAKKRVKKKEPLCPSCDSDQVDVITFDTLSVDARPIQEDEIRCRTCGHRGPKQ